MTSKDSSETKRSFNPLLHEILWTVRRYWWVAIPGLLLIFLCTYGWMLLEGNDSMTFSLMNSDAEILPRIMGIFSGIFVAFSLFRFLWSRRESVLTFYLFGCGGSSLLDVGFV